MGKSSLFKTEVNESLLTFLTMRREDLRDALGAIIDIASENIPDDTWIADSDWNDQLKKVAREVRASLDLVLDFYGLL